MLCVLGFVYRTFRRGRCFCLVYICFVCLMFLLCSVLRAGFAKVTLDSGRSHLHHASWETWQHCAVLIINQFLTLLISWKLTSFHQTHFNRSGIASRSQDGWLSSGWTWNSGSAYLGSPPCWELAPTSHLQLGDQPSSPLISQHHHHNHHHQSSPSITITNHHQTSTSIINHHHLSSADDSAISLNTITNRIINIKKKTNIINQNEFCFLLAGQWSCLKHIIPLEIQVKFWMLSYIRFSLTSHLNKNPLDLRMSAKWSETATLSSRRCDRVGGGAQGAATCGSLLCWAWCAFHWCACCVGAFHTCAWHVFCAYGGWRPGRGTLTLLQKDFWYVLVSEMLLISVLKVPLY